MERKTDGKRNISDAAAIRKRWTVTVFAGLMMVAGILMSFGFSGKNKAEEQERIEEGRRLRMAVSAFFQEKVSDGEGEVMDFCSEMYWMDIGDRDHPLFGVCPDSWNNEGKITGIMITDDGELKEIVHQSLDGSKEVWMMSLENGQLNVEVEHDP